MLNYKQARGREALARIKCHIGVPEGMADAKVIKEAHVNKVPNLKYITVKRLTQELKFRE